MRYFGPSPLRSRRPPSSRCWPVQMRPGRPGEAGSVPGRGRGSPVLSLCWGTLPTLRAPSPASRHMASLTSKAPAIRDPPPPPRLRGEIPTFCGIDSGQIPRARPGRPPGGGPEPPGTGAAPFSRQTHVELSSAGGAVRRACASASRRGRRVYTGPARCLAHTDFLKQTLLFAERVAMPPGSEDQADSIPVCLWGRPLAERLLTCVRACPWGRAWGRGSWRGSWHMGVAEMSPLGGKGACGGGAQCPGQRLPSE